MEGFNRSTRPGQWSGTERTYRKQRDNSNPAAKKLPPYGKELANRLAYGNKPFLVIVCVGKDAWDDSKIWQQQADDSALVLPAGIDPATLQWPVAGLHCVLEWSLGPSPEFIEKLGICLLRAGATAVTVWPSFEDPLSPLWAVEFDVAYGRAINSRWKKMRQGIGTMRLKREGGSHES